MSEYHKINTIFKRDMSSKQKTLLEGEWSKPEFEFLQNNTWVFTEKVDGTNIRVIYKDGKITFGGRTENAHIPTQLIERLNDLFLPQQEKFNELFNGDTVLYGEGYGAKIQKVGSLYKPHQDFVLFDVRCGHWWLNRDSVEDIAKNLGLDIVPITGEGTLHDAIKLVRGGFTSAWGNFCAEGVVARPKLELQTRSGNRIIAKIKCRDFKTEEP